MGKENKRKKTEKKPSINKKSLRNSITGIFTNNPSKVFNYKQISKQLLIKENVVKELVNKVLQEMVNDKFLVEVSRGKFKMKSRTGYTTGKVDLTSMGSAYIICDDLEEDVFVNQSKLNHALQDDVVRIRLYAKRKNRRPEGEVVEIVNRAKENFVGTIELSKNFAFLVTDSRYMPYDLFIPLSKLHGAKHGQKAIARISDWPAKVKNPFGEVVNILGNSGENDTEIHAILAEYDLPFVFPKEIEAEAAKILEEIPAGEYKVRRDFRDITTFTIDPEDAKDFDDALSVRQLENGNWEVGVHIADVTHYVKPGSILDDEASERATSVYLVDRVVPMLPEKLSNKVCSLRPHEDKLTFSAVFEMDAEGNVLNEWFGRTVIHSDRRFTYEEAQKIIETGEGDLKDEVLSLYRIGLNLRRRRFENGAFSFEKVEVKFRLEEETGKPLGVYFKEMKESNELVEEFMLLANKRVAEFIGNPGKGKKAKTFVYRVHDLPNPDKLESFVKFIKQFGHEMKIGSHKDLSGSLNRLVKEIKGKKEQNLIETIAVRTMAKAAYSTNNIGHYGLAFPFYTHFTSPIRRYPDMMVHRLLDAYLNRERSKNSDLYEGMCEHSSEMEKKAADAERASIKYKQVEFLQDKLGEHFDGIISGVTEWGVYVELEDNKCEGMVSIRDIDDDFYILDEENYCLIGKNSKNKYQLGDKVTIEILKANLPKRQLDFKLIKKNGVEGL